MFNYLDLNTLKVEEITKDTHVKLHNTKINIDDNELFLALYNKIRNDLFRVDADDCDGIHLFNISITNNDDTPLNIDTFETIINITLITFFNYIITNQKRSREWRLDVPGNLIDDIHCNSRSLLKKAINYETSINCFQIVINSGDLHFVLVGEPNGD